ncbi:MAG: XRE family transcriptional regulator [Pseudomonadota bacterium]
MNLNEFYHAAHHLVEAKQKRRISHDEMAESLGASTRAYAEWLKGGREPLAAYGAIRILAQLDDADIVKIVREFVATKEKIG